MCLKSGMIREVVSLEGDNLAFTRSVHLTSGLIREVASLEGDNLVVFYSLSAFEI